MKRSLIIGCLALLGGIFSARAENVLYAAKFEPGLAGFRLMNHGPYSDIEVREYAGVKKALVITKKPTATKGTAWEVRGEEFSVTPGERVTVIVRACGTVTAMRYNGGYLEDNYMTEVRWFGAKGERILPVPRSKFGFDVLPSGWHCSFNEFTVPVGAVRASVSLGADRPDFAKDDVVAVSELKVVKTARSAAGRGSVTALRDDGTVLRNGKPFLPIGVYTFRKMPLNGEDFAKGLDQLIEAGFNSFDLAGMYDESVLDGFMSLCERKGVMTFLKPVRGFGEEIYDSARMRKYLDHPSVLCWYLADDTASYTVPEEVDYRRRVCRYLDGGRHLTMQADGAFEGAMNRYQPFLHTTEVFMPEIYPCRENLTNGCEVAETVHAMRIIRRSLEEAGNPAKSIWPILQGFEGWTCWKRYPTYPELRAMAWATFALGAKGLVWYAYSSSNPLANHGMGWSEEYFRRVAEVTREVKKYEADLLGRDAAIQPEVTVVKGPAEDPFGNPSVTCLLKQGANPLFIAVNSTTNSVTAKFDFGEVSRTKTFAPWGVAVGRMK